jgi:hypothetical protein
VSDFTNFMTGKSTANYSHYDVLLLNWSGQILQSGVTLDMGSIQYTTNIDPVLGYSAADARQDIIDNYSWTINDGGQI